MGCLVGAYQRLNPTVVREALREKTFPGWEVAASLALLGGINGYLDQCGAQEFVTKLVAAADLLEDLVVRVLHGFDAAESLVDSWVELCAYGIYGLDAEAAQGVFHLLDDQLHASTKLGHVAFGVQGEGEVIEDAEEGFNKKNCSSSSKRPSAWRTLPPHGVSSAR